MGARDLLVEVVSPGDTRGEVAEKLVAWLSFGMLAVWIVDPAEASDAIGQMPRRLR